MFLFSVVIPTYNRLEKLKITLANLVQQTYKNFEVIIVEDVTNNGNTIKQFNENLNLKYVFLPFKKNVSAKRNIGARNAIGKYLVFLDDDDFVKTDWLKSFANEVKETSDDIAFCGVIYQKQSSVKILLPEKAYDDERDWGIFLAGAFAVKKELFDLICGYDEILRYGENTELGLRLKQVIKSWKFISTSNLVYSQSDNGASRNIENTFIANNHILNKHKDWFEKNPVLYFNYLSVLGVISYKLKKVNLAKQYFSKALKINRHSSKAWARFILSQFPFIAKKVWK